MVTHIATVTSRGHLCDSTAFLLRMVELLMGLYGSEKKSTICLAVLIPYHCVSGGQEDRDADGQTDAT